jgi:hypothetical protein
VPSLFVALAQPPYSDVALEIAYGNPFPVAWPLLIEACVQLLVPLLDTDGNTSMAPGDTCVRKPFDANGSAPPAPVVHPPQAILVGGQDAMMPIQGVGLTPTVSWSPPASGAVPAGYDVLVFREAPVEVVASFTTAETSVAIPEGILEPNVSYSLRIDSLSVLDESRPFFVPDEVADGSAVAGWFTP